MIEVTELIHEWIKCSNDLWARWFVTRENGADEFTDIESALLNVMVINHINSPISQQSTDSFFKRLRVRYVAPVNDFRQVCIKQTAGNIFCQSKLTAISEGIVFMVKAIDTMGTMMNVPRQLSLPVGVN